MNKQGLRYLSLGFFISALILSGTQLMNKTEAAQQEPILTEDSSTYDSSADKEEPEIVDTSAAVSSEAEEEAEVDSSTEADTSEEETETPEAEPEDVTVMIVVKDGQPSSVVAKQLQSEGIIENALEFDTYLEKEDVAKKIRPGNYEVKKGMDFKQIVDVLLKR